MKKERDSEGRLVEDRQRFPSGMKGFGDWLHSQGFQFGIVSTLLFMLYSDLEALSHCSSAAQRAQSVSVEHKSTQNRLYRCTSLRISVV